MNDFIVAEELLQETAAQVFENIDRFDDSRPFLPWSLGIARNVVLKYRRRIARDRHVFSQGLLDHFAQVVQEMSERQDALVRSLSTCRKRLTPRSQEICRLRYEQNLLPQEIASRLGSTPSAVATVLHRMHEQLRNCIEQYLRAEGL